jgi:DNA-binding NarL/FixJ family response regulator
VPDGRHPGIVGAVGSADRQEGPSIHDRAPAAAPIRVGLVDDHPSILASLAAAIGNAPDLVLVGAATTVDDALRLAGHVDVLVCDVQLAGRAEGLLILGSVHDPATTTHDGPPAVIFLSGFEQPSLVRTAIERGAAGYLSKSAELPEILDAIRTVAGGGTAFTASALRGARTARRRPSDREIQVIDRVIAGASNAEIAGSMGLSEKTVESHLRRLFDRYGVLSRTELAVLAIDEGWTSDRRSDR